MTDFAPFVAATLRDKALADLIEENNRLRKKIRSLYKVEITGPKRQPVYARAQFDEDGGYDENPNLWQIGDFQQVAPCPLKDLRNLEVWVCGTLRGSFNNDMKGGYAGRSEVFDFSFFELNNGRKEKIVQICFCHPQTLWVVLNIGWTEEEMYEAGLLGSKKFHPEKEMLDHLCDKVSEADPSKLCRFLSVAPAIEGIRGLVDSVDKGSRLVESIE